MEGIRTFTGTRTKKITMVSNLEMEGAIVELYKKRTGMKYRECRRLYGPSVSNDDDDGDIVRGHLW